MIMHPFTPNNLSLDTNPVEASALTILELLPLLGPTLSKMYSNYALDTRLQRLESFINEVFRSINTNQLEVNNKLNTLDEYNKQLITSLVQKTFNAVQDEIFYEEKKEYFRNCFLKFINSSPINIHTHDLNAFFIDCLKSLSLSDLSILQEIFQIELRNEVLEIKAYPSDSTFPQVINVDPLVINSCLARLRSLGLIAHYVGLSKLGREFIKFCMER